MKKAVILTCVLGLGALCFAQNAGTGSAQGQGRGRGQGPNGAKAPTNEGMYITAEQMQDILDKGPVKDGKPGALSTRLFNANTFSCAFIRVVSTDQPHTHGDWSEVYVIRSGSGDFETGGTMKGPWTSGSAVHRDFFVDQNGKPTAPSAAAQQAPANGVNQGDPPPGVDAAGTSIEGGHIQHVKAGDIVLVPAGTPHVWTKLDGPVVYLDIKFPKATD
jgi:mannose-6-phosphate isomerase-like protein (cupin superfamily)